MGKPRIVLSDNEVQEIFQKAGNFNKKNIDNLMVLMDFKLAYCCALKTNELLSLKIGDVFDNNGEVLSYMSLKDRVMPIPGFLKSELKQYLCHLQKKGYSTGRNAYLFPIHKVGATKNKARSHEAGRRKWHRDLHEVAGEYNVHEKIRQAGIRRYFNQLPQDTDEDHRITKTSEFAGCSEKQVKNILYKP